MSVEDRLRQGLRADAGRMAPSMPASHEVARRGQRIRITHALGMITVIVAALAGGAVVLPTLAEFLRSDEVVFIDRPGDGERPAGYAKLLDALPLEGGEDTLPLLLVGDVPLAAESAGAELPRPGVKEWLVDVEAFADVARHTLWPTGPGFLAAVTQLEDRPFAETLGITPTDVDQWADWHGGQNSAMTLRSDLDDLTAFLDGAGGWRVQGDDPRWYRGDTDADPDLAETVGVHDPDEFALVIDDGLVRFGPAPAAQANENEPPDPGALGDEDRERVGDLPGMQRLAGVLDGWATFAFIAPESHLETYFPDWVGAPAGEPLVPYRHLAFAGVSDERGDRGALVVVHENAADAEENAQRLTDNLTTVDDGSIAEDAEVIRDDDVVIVDWFAPSTSAVIRFVTRLEWDRLAPAVPANLAVD